MNSITSNTDIAAAEAMLAAAGFDPTPVDACSDASCRWCPPPALPAAA